MSIFESFSSHESYENSNAINLYDSFKFEAIHNRELLEFLFFDDENTPEPLHRLNELYLKCKILFYFLVPHEYGITNEHSKLAIGRNVSGNLYRELIRILKSASEPEMPF